MRLLLLLWRHRKRWERKDAIYFEYPENIYVGAKYCNLAFFFLLYEIFFKDALCVIFNTKKQKMGLLNNVFRFYFYHYIYYYRKVLVKGPYQDIKQTIIRPGPVVSYRLKLPATHYKKDPEPKAK